MSYLIKPAGYKALLNLSQTEMGIKKIKDFFQQNLSSELRLRRVTAPLFVLKGMGINDDLNGTERAVTFPIKDLDDAKAEIVHSLAKWKRLTLADYQIEKGYGIYTDMNAIRSDEELGNLHSLYVDQWDWERVMGAEERNVDFLKEIVRRIYAAMVRTEYLVYEMFPEIRPTLPQQIHFIHSEDLLQKYPTFTPKEREDAITKEYGAVFIIGIGCKLSNGEKHDGRAPDYDDWSTIAENGQVGLNGDLLVWDEVLNRSLELSSMGIRVDKEALLRQLEICNAEEKKELYFHKRLLNNELPLSIGGGIGQSRLCMFYLRKAHIGEIQASKPIETTTTTKTEENKDDVPAWAQALIDSNKSLSDKLTQFETEKAQATRSQQILAKAKEYGIPENYAKRCAIKDDEDLDAYFKDLKQEFANDGFKGVTPPESAEEKIEKESESIAKMIDEGTKTIVEQNKN